MILLLKMEPDCDTVTLVEEQTSTLGKVYKVS